MAAMIRPTLLLKMSLDESVFSEDLAAELKRSYAYVSPAMIESHPTTGGDPENIIRCIVKIRQPYWESLDEGTDELWNEVMKTWFKNIFYKISSTMTAHNENREEKNQSALMFSHIEVELEGDNTVIIPLDEAGSIPENALEILDEARAKANASA